MRIAVVGAGVAGLYAAWRLCARPRRDALRGGRLPRRPHQHRRRRVRRAGTWAIDTGFIVFNDWTYPNFIAMLEELGVAWQPSNMSFSLRCERTGLEYNGTSLNSLFAQRRNLLRPSFLRMIADILRFNARAKALLATRRRIADARRVPARDGGYSRQFVEHYIVPMGRAIWSAEASAMLDFPARFFVGFFDRHGFLIVDDRPVWQTVRGGSREYVRALLAASRARPAARRRRWSRSGACRTSVLRAHACAATSRRSTTSSSPATRTRRWRCSSRRRPPRQQCCGALPYAANEAILHTDEQPAAAAAAGAGRVELPPARRPAGTGGADLRHERAAGARSAPVRFLVTLNHRARHRRATGSCAASVRASGLHAAGRRGAGAPPRAERRSGAPISAARTGAAASTRTAW